MNSPNNNGIISCTKLLRVRGHILNQLPHYCWGLITKSTTTCSINHDSIHMVQDFIKILKKQMLKYLMVLATRTQILKSLTIFVETFPRLFLDARDLLSYGGCSGCREEFGQEQSLQVIPAHDGPGCKVVQPILCIAFQGMRKSFQVHMIFLDICRLHGGAHNMELLQMLTQVLTCKSMKLWQEMD